MNLILKPSIYTVASTQINKTEMLRWARDNNLTSSTCESNIMDTPINNLLRDMNDDDHGERLIEFAGRQCYRAWLKGRKRSDYIINLIDMAHTSVLEHSSASFQLSGVSRTLTHELVRHRVGIAISQESQRYVDAADINMVVPPLTQYLESIKDTIPFSIHPLAQFKSDTQLELDMYKRNQRDLQHALGQHFKEDLGEALYDAKTTKAATRFKKRINETARSLLPGASETRLVWTVNYRILRHFLYLRGGLGADLEIRRLACMLLVEAQKLAPTVFGDMELAPLEPEHFGVPVIVHKPFNT